jgi:hypothetical protein
MVDYAAPVTKKQANEVFATFAIAFLFVGLPVTLIGFPLMGVELTNGQQWRLAVIVAAVFSLGVFVGMAKQSGKDDA